MRRLAPLFLLLISSALPAQDADTIVLKSDQQRFTLLSQIDDPAEAAAFLKVLKCSDPGERHQLAGEFINSYPASWLTAQIYDLAARSSIDTDNLDRALQEGRFSLRLLPENPTLLVLLANIEARRKLFEDADRDAHNALEYLDEMERLPNTTDSEWKAVKPQLKASVYFALGRSQTASGLAQKGLEVKAKLKQALDNLDRAAAWNPNDPEVFYLRAIVALNLGQDRAAASDFALVSRSQSPLQTKAADSLRSLYARQTGKESLSFEAWLSSLPKPVVDKTLREGTPIPASSAAISGGYAGPEACKTCHTREYDTWRQTGMARMLRPYESVNIIGDFSPGASYREGGDTLVRMGFDSKPYFEIRADQWRRFYVDYTIGSKWQQAYATKLPDGTLQVIPIEYNLAQKAWINYWKIIDVPGSPRAVIADFPKLLPATNYQQNCAICHTSQLKAAAGVDHPMEHAAFLQPGIDCEMCHGPSAWHIDQIRKGHTGHADAAEPPVDIRRVGNREGVRICAQCHKQSAVREFGTNNEMNYSTGSASFMLSAWSRSYDAFSRKAFYKDGHFRETTFIVEAFTRSACYRRGTAQCASCHTPHLPDFAKNPTSLKVKTNPGEMCLTCHEQYRQRSSEHTHHRSGTEASQCVSCHMPRIAQGLLPQVRSHQIEIPTADLTERFGQNESPNACLLCHAEKSASWAKQQLVGWRR